MGACPRCGRSVLVALSVGVQVSDLFGAAMKLATEFGRVGNAYNL